MADSLFRNIRSSVFWTLDSLKGGRIRAHLTDIDTIFNNSFTDNSVEKLNERLNALLKHAVSSTPFYLKYSNYRSLEEFPVINKNIINKYRQDFFSDKFERKELSEHLTSGSTGIPFRVCHDPGKRIRTNADTIYFNRIAGFELGSKLYYLRAWDRQNRKSAFSVWAQNIFPISISDLTPANIDRIIDMLGKEKRPVSILGYASTLETICQYLDRNNPRHSITGVNAIIAIAENLNDNTKDALKKHFNAAIVSRYSNNENGIIAQQLASGGTEFYINHASYHIEILGFDKDKPVCDGEMGRIVITDYFNYGMPLIRYDTGDIGRSGTKRNGRGVWRILTIVEGRKMDFLKDTRGNLVSPYVLTTNMCNFADLRQSQLIQTGPGHYLLVLNCDRPYPREEEIVREFKQYLGDDANIEIEYTDEIPLLSSGKRKRVVNNLNQA